MGPRRWRSLLLQHQPSVRRRVAGYVPPSHALCLAAPANPHSEGAVPAPPHFSDEDLPTIDALIEEKRRQAAKAVPPPPAPKKQPAEPAATTPKPSEEKAADKPSEKADEKPAKEDATAVAAPQGQLEPGSPEALEHEAQEQGAFNPETGEINWDCPCLGGMAHGPCGEEFKAAFSCFVYSKEEPKGMDCIDKFQYAPTPGGECVVDKIAADMT